MGAGEAEISSCSLQIRLPLTLNGHMAAESSANLEQFTSRQMRERSVVTPGGVGGDEGGGGTGARWLIYLSFSPSSPQSTTCHLSSTLTSLPVPAASKPPLCFCFLVLF